MAPQMTLNNHISELAVYLIRPTGVMFKLVISQHFLFSNSDFIGPSITMLIWLTPHFDEFH